MINITHLELSLKEATLRTLRVASLGFSCGGPRGNTKHKDRMMQAALWNPFFMTPCTPKVEF